MFNRFFIIVYIAIIVTSMFVCYYRFQDYGRLIQKDTVYVNVSDSSSIIIELSPQKLIVLNASG